MAISTAILNGEEPYLLSMKESKNFSIIFPNASRKHPRILHQYATNIVFHHSYLEIEHQ